MSVVKLKKEKQKKLRVLSKIIAVLSLIGKVFIWIAIPFIVLGAIAIPIVISKVEVKDDVITYDNKVKITFAEDEESYTVDYKDDSVKVDEGVKEAIQVRNYLKEHSKKRIIAFGEYICIAALASLIISLFVLRYIRKLFKNIVNEDTPFTLENVKYIRKIAYFLIASILVPILFESGFDIIFNSSFNISFGTVDITLILALFVLAYVFEYGYELQAHSKSKIYGEVDE